MKVKKGGKLEAMLAGGQEQIIEEMFWAGLSRPPSDGEKRVAGEALARNKEQGAEDLLWAMCNRLDFLFY